MTNKCEGHFHAPDGTCVDEDGFIIEPGHPQEGCLWVHCWGVPDELTDWTPDSGGLH